MKLKKYVKKVTSFGCAFSMTLSLGIAGNGFIPVNVLAKDVQQAAVNIADIDLNQVSSQQTNALEEVDYDASVNSVADAFKEKEDNAISRMENTGDVSMLFAENNIETDSVDERSSSRYDSLPSSYDLRDKGVVTPVKFQNPFGTCWGFASIAAAETSILSETGKTYKETGLDLSEHHLAWFAESYLPEDGSAQAGEGMYHTSPNALLNAGGMMWYATSVFSSGIGPIPESACPYKGKYGIIAKNSKGKDSYYSADDDWSVDESLRFKQSFELEESAVLPSTRKINAVTGEYEGYDEKGTNAIKEELMTGKAVSVTFYADTSQPGQVSQGQYINLDTWAHYTYDVTSLNHAVTIVGWDDNYSKNNFIDHTNDADGDGEAHLPEGDGAWIVKNSWGADTEDFPNHNSWGYKDENGNSTGYFYLSYYDRSLSYAETFDFYTEADDEQLEGYIIDEHDFLVAQNASSILFPDETWMANVFTAEENQSLRAVSTQTANQNTQVNYQVYLLKDDAKNPTDGVCVSSIDKSYRYAGYHRENLDNEVYLPKGQKYSIVVKHMVVSNGSKVYEVQSSSSWNQSFLDTLSAKAMGITSYNKAVVNKGESYFSDKDAWLDWSDVTDILNQGYYDYDNFSIKGYSDYSEPYGLVLDGDVWHYYKDGVIDNEYDGLVANAYGLWYVKNGEVQFNYNGLYNYNDKWGYIKGGLYTPNYTGVAFYNNKWSAFLSGMMSEESYTGGGITPDGSICYFENGEKIEHNISGLYPVIGNGTIALYIFDNGIVDMEFDGLKLVDITPSSGLLNGMTGEYVIYQKNGQICLDKNVLCYEGIWCYVINGMINGNFNGLAENQYGWWAIKDGKVDFTYTGFMVNQYGKWYVQNGGIDFGYTALVQDDNGEWLYVENGKNVDVYFKLVQNEYGWWCVNNGKVDFTYTGIVANEYGYWAVENGGVNFGYNGLMDGFYVENGAVNFGYTGLAQDNSGDWLYITEGIVEPEYTGLVQNEYGWWYVEEGKVNFNYTSLAQNEYGWWYVENGGVNFGFTGSVVYEGNTYNVVNGLVQ